MSAIENCRTAALGGHVARCENEKRGYTQIAYNSCRNRHCPKCQSAAAREWLAGVRKPAQLLTSSIRNLWRSCPRSALSCAHQPLLGQLRLFGRVRCYRQSLHTDGIETQNLGKTICDVPTAESI